MPANDPFLIFFDLLKSILQPYAASLIITTDTAEAYSLDGLFSQKWQKEVFFGAAQIKKNYVSAPSWWMNAANSFTLSKTTKMPLVILTVTAPISHNSPRRVSGDGSAFPPHNKHTIFTCCIKQDVCVRYHAHTEFPGK